MSQIIINGQPLYQVDLPEMTLAEYNALPVAERPQEWIRTDGSPCLYYENDMMPASYPASRVTHESVSVTQNGTTKNYTNLLDELFALIDATKITIHSILEVTYSSGNKAYYYLVGNYLATNELRYAYERSSDTSTIVETFYIRSSSSVIYTSTNGTITNPSSQIPSVGTKITLYY